MKKTVLLLTQLLVVVAVISGFSFSQDNQVSSNTEKVLAQNGISIQTENEDEEEIEVDLEKGTEVVLAIVEKLKGTLKAAPDDTKQINQLGESLEENWDMIEKEVEEKYPDDYAKIEKSLYPLIAIAKKDNPDLKELKKYLKDSEKMLMKFKEKAKAAK
ncbi:hypothetical protein GH741_14760 [Aquibacillus halophilus]|uniref:Uncharacterized protein n=1 Tax=Aquibacillus halophilus TaxID=930132 RepID=A0A6A8DJH5_9BACI|nr:hypothetical protein [Aquibacillus halophilus]MRH43901.1 hypothetical protein [Aquibacillus halophilus]